MSQKCSHGHGLRRCVASAQNDYSTLSASTVGGERAGLIFFHSDRGRGTNVLFCPVAPLTSTGGGRARLILHGDVSLPAESWIMAERHQPSSNCKHAQRPVIHLACACGTKGASKATDVDASRGHDSNPTVVGRPRAPSSGHHPVVPSDEPDIYAIRRRFAWRVRSAFISAVD